MGTKKKSQRGAVKQCSYVHRLSLGPLSASPVGQCEEPSAPGLEGRCAKHASADAARILQEVLDAASERVAKWPEWRRSGETRRQLDALARTRATKPSERENKVQLRATLEFDVDPAALLRGAYNGRLDSIAGAWVDKLIAEHPEVRRLGPPEILLVSISDS